MALNRRSPILPALSLLALVLPYSAQPAPPPSKTEKKIDISLDQNGKPVANPDSAILYYKDGNGDIAHWHLVGAGKLTIKMKTGEDPFTGPIENAGSDSRSTRAKDKPVADEHGKYKKYRYNITVETPDGVIHKADPDVEIQP